MSLGDIACEGEAECQRWGARGHGGQAARLGVGSGWCVWLGGAGWVHGTAERTSAVLDLVVMFEDVEAWLTAVVVVVVVVVIFVAARARKEHICEGQARVIQCRANPLP